MSISVAQQPWEIKPYMSSVMFDFATMGYNHKEKLLFKMSTGKITHESKILEALPFYHLYPYGH